MKTPSAHPTPHTPHLLSQTGAMFGLDARISLAIFAALAVIAGAYTAGNISDLKAKSFSKELAQTAQAIEAIHNDLRVDVHTNLIDNTDSNAYIALYDNIVLEQDIRGKWLGPYITRTTPFHPEYGESRIQKRGPKFTEDCSADATCYLWLSFDNLPLGIGEALNITFDGKEEQDPQLQGRIQWQGGQDAGHIHIAFRTSRALGGASYF